MIFDVSKCRLNKRFILMLFKFKRFPTFRSSKMSWNGDKIAFEQNLLDKKVKWFVYIKFYTNNKGKNIPLVVGKSGSCFVNSSGSDLNFSTSIKDGNARKFLYKNKLKWHYTNILIRKCKSQEEAYRIETKIMNKFNLFGS